MDLTPAPVTRMRYYKIIKSKTFLNKIILQDSITSLPAFRSETAHTPVVENARSLDKSSEIEADKSSKSDVSGSNSRSSDSDEVL